MPNFKPKAKKKFKINKKSTMTLDSKHNEKMNSFQKIKNVQIPNLIAKKINLANGLDASPSDQNTGFEYFFD